MKIDVEGLKSFIPEEEIWSLLNKNEKPTHDRVMEILEKAKLKRGLDLEEVSILIQSHEPEMLENIFKIAKQIKEDIYGRRIVLFAPLYVGNECINNCVYCGFRISNKECHRATLSSTELVNETLALENQGHKRLIMVYGEHPMYSPEYIKQTVETVYATKTKNGDIRRVNINAAPLDVEGFKTVKSSGIGTYQIFQETYHQETYQKMHPSGPKSNYLWRLYGLDRAMEADIDDLGIGALLGLYDWRFEVMALLAHSFHLEEKYGVGPHTISFPRIEPALGSDFTNDPEYAVSDDDFKKLVAILRLAVPYTGMILTAREPIEVRNEVINYGVSQIDGGSSIGIGAYAATDEETTKKSQFVLGDNRSLDEVVRELAEHNFIPSWCTACYRLGRTGEDFMGYSKSGEIKSYCQPNAILTFTEYLNDYASPETKKAGIKLIEDELPKVPEGKIKEQLKLKLERLYAGEHDMYF
ncbi:MAG: [FeFe] hydrogenase H-cluster radical SAM maturase HydG [Candidatus Zophobacter franzmannii]|nr:[FeFe] hydrogenase H-cluster radical SAM maturase HydG [Candidatus Zophobacter franzmannii]